MFFGRAIILGAAVAAAFSTLLTSARAQDAREAEIIGLHQLCDHGDRRACVRFGMLMQELRDRHVEWERSHPEWFWWQH